MTDDGTTADSVTFPVIPGLLEATRLLFVANDPWGALARVEHESAFVLYERSERRRLGLDRLRELGHGQLLDAYLQRAKYASELGSLLVIDDREGTMSAAMADLTTLTDAIRRVPGFESFLLYPSMNALIDLNYPDAVAWVVSIDAGGYALLLEPGRPERLSVLPLPELRAGQAYAQAIHAWYAYRQASEAAAVRTIDSVAAWCWETCMGPLSELLPEKSRLTLVPVGVAQLLPLHVAWSQDGPRRTYVTDRIAVSIAPNMRLAAANRRPAAATGDAVAAFAPQATQATATLPQLPWSRQETTSIAAGSGSRAFLDQDATIQAFLDSIGSYSRVHFAGHALASISVPWASHLEFFDGPATIARIAESAPTRDSELGILSCCTGALGSAVRPTLGVTIAGVLLASCFRRVVASLWRVRDDYGAILTARFHWLLDSDAAAHSLDALTQAQQWLRDAPIDEVHTFAQARNINHHWIDQSREQIASWGAFFHAGPSS